MHKSRGNVAIKVALSLTVLFGVASVTIDLAWARFVREQLDVAAQAASHGGALQLDGTGEGVAAAHVVVPNAAEMNAAAGVPVRLNGSDWELGVWSIYTKSFTPGGDPSEINAVRVTAERPSLGVFFAPAAFNRNTVDVGTKVTAVRLFGGASEMNCALPIGIPDCLITNLDTDEDGLIDVAMNPQTPQIDQMGWARPFEDASSSWTRSALQGCMPDAAADIGDPVALQNGLSNTSMETIISIMGASETTWDTDALGPRPAQLGNSSLSAATWTAQKTLEGPIYVFDGGPNGEYCQGAGGAFNGTEPITGFAWIAIYDVANHGAASTRTIAARIDTTRTHEVGEQGGGPDWGITADPAPHFVASD